MRFPLLLVGLVAAQQVPIGPASEQFGLNLVDHASECFRSCHNAATQVLFLPDLGINSAVFITRNCQLPRWADVIGACLPMVCKSAPDVAYAVEFAHAWCRRAGVHNVSIELPQWYLDTPGGAYYQNTLVSSATHGSALSVGLGALAVAAALAV